MSMTLSSTAAAAKAAKADLSAPVAANNGQAESAPDSRAAQAKPPVRNSQAQAEAPKRSTPAPAQAPARSAPASQTAQTGKAGKTAASDQASQSTDETADEAVTAAPLFAQLLTLADLAAAGQDGAAGDAKSDSDASDAGTGASTGAVSAADALPAMTHGILSGPLTAFNAPGYETTARSDAVSAVSTLNASATRLNLAAVGVAVTPAVQQSAAESAESAAAATQAAATLVTTSAQAATPQGVYSQAGNAALAALARNQRAEAPAADADAAVQAAPAAPVAEAEAAPAVPAAAVAAAPRVQVRVADTAAGNAPDYNTATPAATATAKDDSRVAAAAASGAAGNTVGFAPAAPAAAPGAATVKLAGSPEQWQQPLREALGDRLQVQLQRNNDHAVIRLEPPNMGSIEISIRHSAGALQVNLSASNSEVVRQLNTIGDSVRQDLSTRQFADVAVTVSSSRAQAQADTGGGRSGQQRNQDDGRTPGRALSEDETTSTFAMNERE
jgi:flagellar hook-length control protein FliK